MRVQVADFTEPTAEQFANASKRLASIRKLTSPVFLSTTADGRRVAGLGGLPSLGSAARGAAGDAAAGEAGSADERGGGAGGEGEASGGSGAEPAGGDVGDGTDARRAPPALFVGNHQLCEMKLSASNGGPQMSPLSDTIPYSAPLLCVCTCTHGHGRAV